MGHKVHSLTIFSLTMITVGSVDSIRNLPATALFGSQLIFYFLLATFFFLIPVALVSAELASGWPKQGGIYIWVKQAFGKRTGFLAIWLQWIENVIWYPTILSFVAGTIGYLINPDLTNSPYFLWFVIVSSFWGATLLNLQGMHSSALFSNFCSIAGLLIPMALIITLGLIWIIQGNGLQINFAYSSLVPHLTDKSMWVSLTAIIMSFCGIEIATVHANHVDNPQYAFPRSLIYAVIIILTTLILGSLAIAIVLPGKDINLVAGIMQAFEAFFKTYHIHWIMPFIAMMLVLGGLGSVSNWIIAPTTGLMVAAKEGNLPLIFQKSNNKGAPVVMLLSQAIIVTLLSTLFLFMPSVNGSYWLLTALAAQLYMLMYLIMLISAIRLRIQEPDHPRPFKIPGGLIGISVVAGIGIIGVLTAFFVSFIPPKEINVGSLASYEMTLLGGLILMCLPPLICSRWVMPEMYVLPLMQKE